MNDIAQIIVALATLVTAVGGLVVSLRNGRNVARVAADVQTIEKATNSMKDQLVAATGKAAFAEGTAAGLQQGRDEHEPIKVEITKVPPKALG